MPIRINLLAESQALDDMRRRDPVKRAIWVGVCLGLLLLAWSSSIQLKAMIAKGELNRLQSQLKFHTNEYQQVLEHQKKLREVDQKLEALIQLSTNRMLNGNILEALQHTTIDEVQLVRLRTEHAYVVVEETKSKTNTQGRVVRGKPASITEKITLTLDAKDSGPNPGDQVPKFQEAVADCSYFQGALGKTNVVRLTNITPPQPGVDGRKPHVNFTLECKFPERTR